MKNPLWPLTIEPLPLKDSPEHPESEGYYIFFHPSERGVTAQIYTSDGMIVDVITAHTFMECYDSVATNYPRASWRPN